MVFVAAIATALALPDPAEMVALVALLALLIAYCVARPSSGLEVFLIACLPSATSSIFASILGAERWWIAVPLIPVALVMLVALDRDPVPKNRTSASTS